MDFRVKTSSLDKLKSDCLIVQTYGDKTLSKVAQQIDEQTGGALSRAIKSEDLGLKAGKICWITAPADTPYSRILAACIGENPQQLSQANIESSANAVAKAIKAKAIKSAFWSIENLSEVANKTFAILIARSFTKASYVYTTTKSKDIKQPALNKLTLHSMEKFTSEWKNGLAAGEALGDGINFARQLGNLPGNICTPVYLAQQATQLCKNVPNTKLSILDEKQLKKLGMGSMLSVAAGSEEPPRLIVMEYLGGAKTKKPKVLIGKGITFDTGGISLKPGLAMDEMKFDMCGAASVFGVMKTLIALKAPVNVVGIVAAAENMPSGKATKPGDVVTSMSGQTIEILNTDAEGRLVLCDALSYAERYKPDSLIDIATLTGACVIALGSHASGLMANDQSLAEELLEAGQKAADRAWQLPLWDDYQKSLDSNFADMANIGSREAGTITAACFLSRYTKGQRWAHLDIAGTAWNSGAAKGATGRPVSLLVEYLINIFE